MNQSYGKIVALGNMIHYDCFMARLQTEPDWKYLRIPIIDNGKIAWKTSMLRQKKKRLK
jgi:hypothetical protein